MRSFASGPSIASIYCCLCQPNSHRGSLLSAFIPQSGPLPLRKPGVPTPTSPLPLPAIIPLHSAPCSPPLPTGGGGHDVDTPGSVDTCAPLPQVQTLLPSAAASAIPPLSAFMLHNGPPLQPPCAPTPLPTPLPKNLETVTHLAHLDKPIHPLFRLRSQHCLHLLLPATPCCCCCLCTSHSYLKVCSYFPPACACIHTSHCPPPHPHPPPPPSTPPPPKWQQLHSRHT
jgi:hypothetical protein